MHTCPGSTMTVSPTGPRRPSLRVERALQRDGHRVLAGELAADLGLTGAEDRYDRAAGGGKRQGGGGGGNHQRGQDRVHHIVAIARLLQDDRQTARDKVEDLGLHFLLDFDRLEPGSPFDRFAQIEPTVLLAIDGVELRGPAPESLRRTVRERVALTRAMLDLTGPAVRERLARVGARVVAAVSSAEKAAFCERLGAE